MNGRLVVVLGLVLTVGTAIAGASTPSWITDARLGSTLLRVDVATGERSFVDVSAYPLVLALGAAGIQSPANELFLEAVNAAQGVVLVRYEPGNGEVVGVSGYVAREGDGLRGAGPDLEPGLAAVEVGPWGVLYALREGAGPMRVDVASGDRVVLSQSAEPPAGEGVFLHDPVDLVVERGGSLLVADRFGGLVRVDPGDSSREAAYLFEDLVEGPHRLERLADGRVLHAFGEGGGREVTVFDRGLMVASELSGPFRGSGPDLAGIADLVVAPDGAVYVLDLSLRAVVAIDPATGNRRLIAEDLEGSDLGLLSPNARFVGYALPKVSPPPRTPRQRVAAP